MGFEMVTYVVEEGGEGVGDTEVEICVVVKRPGNITCPVVYSIDFIVTFTDISAGMYSYFSSNM